MKSTNIGLFFIAFGFNLQLIGCGDGSSSPPLPPASPTNAQITITLTGVPVDVDADVTLSISVNGVGTVWNINQSQTVTNLSPGTYSLRSFTFQKGLTEYVLQSNSAQVVQLAAGESKSAQVDYDIRDVLPATLNLNIDKTLMQNGDDNPSIVITGPEGYSQSFSDSTVVTDLVPGEYSVLAPDFIGQTQSYGFYFDFFRFGFREGDVLNNNAIITPVPVRIKSIESLSNVTISGISDGQGNFYTVENQHLPPQALGVSTHLIHKWNAQGVNIWTTEILGQTYQFWDWKFVVDNFGNVYLAGYESTGIFVGIQNRNLQAQLYKYNSSGQFVWKSDLPLLFGGEVVITNQLGVQDNKVVVFSTREPLQGNFLGPREALISLVNSDNGNILSTTPDSSIDIFTQLIPIDNQGYWVFATDRIIHYSSEGLNIESFVTGEGVELAGKELTGGVAFQPDPLGGFYILTTIEGPNDSDIQLSKYDSNFAIEWQETITNLGLDYIEKISYDDATGRIFIHFFTRGNFPNMKGGRVISEWDSAGNQIWLRQFPGLGGLTSQTDRDLNMSDWRITNDVPVNEQMGQYGMGNSIIVGP